MDVVGGRAGVTAQQLSSVFAHSAKLHVVVLLLAGRLLLLLLLVFGLPLDALLLLEAQIWFRSRLNVSNPLLVTQFCFIICCDRIVVFFYR